MSGIERIQTTDELSTLDGINFVAANEILHDTNMRSVFEDVRVDAMSSEAVRYMKSLDTQTDDNNDPKTFDEILDTSTGTTLQRLKKFLLKTGNPESAQKVLTMVGARHFRELIRRTAGRHRKKLDAAQLQRGENTNYFLADASDKNLLDFALTKTTYNETVHALGAALFLLFMAEGTTPAFSTAAFLFNAYCCLAQRLTRAEIAALINRKLSRRGKLDLEGYFDKLNLRLPTK